MILCHADAGWKAGCGAYRDLATAEVAFLNYGAFRMGDDEAAEAYRDQQYNRTLDLVAENWLAVQATADLLLKHRTLTYADVRWIVRECQAGRRPAE